jgi:hypothetical protein
MLDDPIPELAGALVSPTETVGPIPTADAGNQFVSIRFWQVERPRSSPDDIEVVDKVLRAVLAPDVLPAEEEARGQLEDELGPAYSTVVDVVTVAVPGHHERQGLDAMSAAYDRCVDYLDRLIRAYRVANGELIPGVTRQRLPILSPFVTRPLNSQEQGRNLSLFLAHMNVPDSAREEPLSDAEMEQLGTFLSLLSRGHPLVAYAERSLDARRVLVQEGDTATAVILTQTSVEVLLDGVLTLMLWEEGTSVLAATEIFGAALPRRVRREYAPRLGGRWDPTAPGPVGDFFTVLAPLRGRVVHGAHVPTPAEAHAATAVADGVDAFVRDRLAARRNRYPRTALLTLGQPGLERLGAWGGRIRQFAERADEEPDWLTSYRTWRDDLDRRRRTG